MGIFSLDETILQLSKVFWVNHSHKMKKVVMLRLLHVQFWLHFCQLDFLNTHNKV